MSINKNIIYVIFILLVAGCTDKNDNQKTNIKLISYRGCRSLFFNKKYQEAKTNFANIVDKEYSHLFSPHDIVEASNALILINANDEYLSSHYSSCLNILKQIPDGSEWFNNAKGLKTSIDTIVNKNIYEYAEQKQYYPVYTILIGIDTSYENYQNIISNLKTYSNGIKLFIDTLKYNLELVKAGVAGLKQQMSSTTRDIEYDIMMAHYSEGLADNVRDQQIRMYTEFIDNNKNKLIELKNKMDEMEKGISVGEELIRPMEILLEIIK